ncbi:UDP-3-O-(3-hydroxymyristoyl)glucosamine N-acyltransferase [Pseudomonadales bacterium]|nr:UDP-3-O-(3-hydroxymyristoyl)glucosamine N-acyltransferase [Pseudomonadales bacterium]MDB4035650.1 UDP-3-O-(3-hydroxymyristoyl)glucosamine N-acyltransferase [Pseudomonadales bacterium]MDC1314498.1 UDP-3-O-(3-hydroxymyristoyl)glucosamine N-acyltransferase [Pseudomonadales bacterium]
MSIKRPLLATTLARIGEQFGLTVVGDGRVKITGIAALDEAGPEDITFLFSAKYLSRLPTCQAGAVVVSPKIATALTGPGLIAEQPRLAWARIATLFDVSEAWPDIHPTAQIDQTAELAFGVSIGPNSVVRAGAVLGLDVALGSGVVVGENVHIGDGSQIHSNVVLYHQVQIGSHCIIHANAVIGADGFGFEFDPEAGGLVKIPQVYGVRIGDEVELGAGTTIDRGALTDTEVGDGVKIDNQVQIGHGTKIGAHTVISGATAIAGSTRIGRYCMIGGAVGIIDNLTICDRVEITAMSLVTQSISDPGRYSSGTGLMPSKQWKRNVVIFKKLDDLYKRLRKLES